MKILSRLILFIIALIGVFAVFLAIDFKKFYETPLNLSPDNNSYELKPGANIGQVANALVESELISHPYYFIALARWQGVAHQIKTGEYEIAADTTPPQFLRQIVDGKVTQYSVTLIEGLTFRQALSTINANENLVHHLAGKNDKQIMTELGWPDEHPEGRFYPDTYHFTRGMSDVDILQRSYRMMQKYLENAWSKREKSLPLKNSYEALILASIVEKETGLRSEQAQIAGVFIRRLNKKMRLQTDPTVIYGMGDRYDGNIRRRDLVEHTPYNTYRIPALPPTPIALPGGAAIDAVMHPLKGETLYFVSKGDGSHYFSVTLEEHNKAVAKYQLGR